MPNTLIIAEAGVNHNGSVDLAYQLIDAAIEAGANVVKFQTFIPEAVISVNAPKAAYQQAATGESESQLDMVKKLYLPFSDFLDLKHYADTKGIEFLTTAFDNQSIDFLHQLNLKRVKIPSGELTNLLYLRRMAEFDLPLLLSTGMASLQEVDTAFKVLLELGVNEKNITILHCNTEYPTPLEDVNLNAMNTMAKYFNVNVGYSDHTIGTEVAMAAVAMGATVIEKHFTLSKTMAGPDHQASLEPGELHHLVKQIRKVETILGNAIKEPSSSETPNILIARKSIVASKPIKKGELFTLNNLCAKRPGTGISPMQIDTLINQPANRDFLPDELIAL